MKRMLIVLGLILTSTAHGRQRVVLAPSARQPETVQARSVPTCITDAAPNAGCKVLMVWPSRFADTSYITSCMVVNPSVDGGLYVVSGESAQPGQIVITVRNSPGNSERTFGTLHCIAFGVLASGPTPAKSTAPDSKPAGGKR